MDSESRGIPAEHLTIDQVVARNIRHWRRQAGMTQDELGRRLGWSAANVSAAERSADPSRDPRRFDAQTLAELSLALSVPLVSLFFPPQDDGERVGYIFSTADGEHDMGDLMSLVVMTDSDDDQPVMEAYRERFREAVGHYLDEKWETAVAAWLQPAEEKALRAERADRLRAAGERVRAELESLADAIDPPEDAR